MERTLRPRSNVNYTNDSQDTVGSASKWKEDTTRIRVDDVQEMFPCADLPADTKSLVIPEWKDEEWIRNVKVRDTVYDNKVKTLIAKIKKEAKSISEVIVDGFMESMLNIKILSGFLGLQRLPLLLVSPI